MSHLRGKNLVMVYCLPGFFLYIYENYEMGEVMSS